MPAERTTMRQVREAGHAWTAEIDALAVRRGAGKYVRIDRSSVKFPPTDFNRIGQSYTSLCGTVVRIEIDRSTGGSQKHTACWNAARHWSRRS